MGLELPVDEFLETMAYFAGRPVEEIRKLWDEGATLGSLVLGFGQKDGKPYIPGVIGTDPNEIT